MAVGINYISERCLILPRQQRAMRDSYDVSNQINEATQSGNRDQQPGASLNRMDGHKVRYAGGWDEHSERTLSP